MICSWFETGLAREGRVCGEGFREMFGDGFFRELSAETKSLHRAYAPLNRIEAYWTALREGSKNGRGLPERAQIDPRGIGQDLRHAFIVERIAPDLCQIRVCGAILSSVMGTEARGLPLSRAFAEKSRANLGQVVRESFDGPAIASIKLLASKGLLHGDIVGEMRLFPLVNSAGEVARLLGAVAFSGRNTPPESALVIQSTALRQVHAITGARTETGAPRLRPTHVPYLRVLCMDE